MKNGDVITFDAKKNFTYVKPLGNGGTGDTYLFKDETTDSLFAIKKYVPKIQITLKNIMLGLWTK